MDTRTSYDRISPAYDLLADASESACRDHGLSALDLSCGERVLEVGFGTGHALATMAGAVGPTGLAVGVDISSGMLGVTRRALNNAGAVSVALALDDARSLCFRDAVFDAVFMSFTLELFELADIATVLREVERVLRPTGRLVVVAMAEAPHSNAATNIYKWLHGHFPHFVDCRPIEVNGVLERAGFRAARAELMSIWGLQWPLCSRRRLVTYQARERLLPARRAAKVDPLTAIREGNLPCFGKAYGLEQNIRVFKFRA